MPDSLLLITGIFPPDSGGPARFAMEFGKWSSNAGALVRVQTYSTEGFSDFQKDGLRIGAVSREKSILSRYFEMIKIIGKLSKNHTSVLAVGAFLETYFSSLVYRFSYTVKVPGDIVWERARNSGLTKSNINEFQNEKLNLKYLLFRKIYTRSLKRARLVIVPSMGLFNLCVLWGIPASKIKLIFNSVDIDGIPSKVSSEKIYDLLTVCRLTSWKAVDEIIIYAAKRNRSLCVIGDGPERDQLIWLAESLDAPVQFLGDLAHEQVFDFFEQSRVFVLNSYYEGLPHALVEARAAGILSVARDGTGSAEVIHDDVDGFLIRPDRPLSETLDMALDSAENGNLMISRAKFDTRNRFCKEKNYTEILKIVLGN